MHTHQSDESTTDTIKTETTPSDPLLAMVHRSINTSDDDASDISNVLSVKRSRQIQVCQCYLIQHANHTNQQLVDHGANGGLAGSDMRVIHKTHRKINIQGIDNHEVTGLDVVTAATLLNTSRQNSDILHTSGCLMVDVPCLDHLWDGQKDFLDVGQVMCFHEETSRKTTFLEGRYKEE